MTILRAISMFTMLCIAAAGRNPATASASMQKTTDASCSVSITEPRPGTPVDERGIVAGSATIPANGHLWILARKKTINGWWPQGSGETPVTGGKWQVEVAYGVDTDKGPFEVAAAVFGEDANTALDKWVQTAPERKYPPIKFPPTVEGCPIAKLEVVKR